MEHEKKLTRLYRWRQGLVIAAPIVLVSSIMALLFAARLPWNEGGIIALLVGIGLILVSIPMFYGIWRIQKAMNKEIPIWERDRKTY